MYCFKLYLYLQFKFLAISVQSFGIKTYLSFIKIPLVNLIYELMKLIEIFLSTLQILARKKYVYNMLIFFLISPMFMPLVD